MDRYALIVSADVFANPCCLFTADRFLCSSNEAWQCIQGALRF